MFTGLVDHCAELIKLISIEESNVSTGCQLILSTRFTDLELGESIAVDGVCLTVTSFVVETGEVTFDVSPETLRLTSLGEKKAEEILNVERALCPTDRLGGHFVTGHVDQTAQVTAIEAVGEYIKMTFSGLTESGQAHLVHKGSVCVNGVSLTVNETIADSFNVMLIPHTLARTNLSGLTVGSRVNIEYDLLARFIVKKLASMQLEVLS